MTFLYCFFPRPRQPRSRLRRWWSGRLPRWWSGRLRLWWSDRLGRLFAAGALAALLLATGAFAAAASAGLITASARPASARPALSSPQPAAAPARPAGRFRWPLDGTPPVVRRFDPPPQPWLAGHRGVDLGAVPRAPVRAAATGTVHFAGQVAGRGVVSVDHVGGLRTTYEPLVPVVHEGQRVATGDLVGWLVAGHTGCPVAACLHWGLRRGDAYLDPLSLLGLARVRLLPP
jgi:murein DD-endopeptidase MepM/ murein hydrolase activator NlpD